jgi:hypothetical protein
MNTSFKAVFIFVLLAITVSPTSSLLAGAEDSEELAAIERVVKLYFEGSRTGNQELLKRAFHPAAELKFCKDGAYEEWSATQYISWQRPREAPIFEAKILSLDFTGSCASAKVEIDRGRVRFVDFLSLLKIEGEWRIVNKVFHQFESKTAS